MLCANLLVWQAACAVLRPIILWTPLKKSIDKVLESISVPDERRWVLIPMTLCSIFAILFGPLLLEERGFCTSLGRSYRERGFILGHPVVTSFCYRWRIALGAKCSRRD